jgi:hypothetical protein
MSVSSMKEKMQLGDKFLRNRCTFQTVEQTWHKTNCSTNTAVSKRDTECVSENKKTLIYSQIIIILIL